MLRRLQRGFRLRAKHKETLCGHPRAAVAQPPRAICCPDPERSGAAAVHAHGNTRYYRFRGYLRSYYITTLWIITKTQITEDHVSKIMCLGFGSGFFFFFFWPPRLILDVVGGREKKDLCLLLLWKQKPLGHWQPAGNITVSKTLLFTYLCRYRSYSCLYIQKSASLKAGSGKNVKPFYLVGKENHPEHAAKCAQSQGTSPTPTDYCIAGAPWVGILPGAQLLSSANIFLVKHFSM